MTPRRAYALVAAGTAAFVVYGSLVPFRFRDRPLSDTGPAFRRCMVERFWPESRSDGLANFALGVPLGFALLGACPAGRRAVLAGPLWLGCVGLAAGVEFAQLYVPGRTCAGSDVLAQSLGAVAGMAGWLAAGGWLTRRAVAVVTHPRAGGAAGRRLAAYLAVVGGVQMLPLDLSPSPADAYRKLRNGTAVLVPFAEPADAAAVQKWLTLAVLFLPAGVLAARVPTLPGWLAVLGGFGFAAATEVGQLLVTRHPSVTDALVGGAGVLAGYAAGRAIGGRA